MAPRVLRAPGPRMKRVHVERGLDEGEAHGGFGYGLRGRLPVAVPGRGLHPQQDGRVGSLRLAERGRELEGVAGEDRGLLLPPQRIYCDYWPEELPILTCFSPCHNAINKCNSGMR